MDERQLRGVADLLRASLVAGVPALLIAGRTKDAFAMALIATTACVLRLARAPAPLDLAFVAALAADAWATSLGAFASFNRSDHVGHLVLSALATALLFHLARRVTTRAPGLAAIAAAGLTLGIAWELVEAAADATIGTNMSLSAGDTLGDLAADAAGALASAGLISVRGAAPARGAGRPEDA